VPFLVSIALLAVGGWVRLGLAESPVFRAMQEAGATADAPLRDALLRGPNLRRVLLALFGLVAGQAVVWYTAQFHALTFLTQSLKVDETRASVLMAVALALGAPCFALFGAWSDRVGRKPIVMAGLLLAVLSSFPLFHALTQAANPALAQAQAASRVVVEADPQTCSIQFNLLGTARYTSPCDLARRALARASVSFDDEPARPGYPTLVHVGDVIIGVPTAEGLSSAEARLREFELRTRLQAALDAAGYPARADPAHVNAPAVVAILWLLIVVAAMVYGPLAAMLVEMFPARVRYTSMSLPYHVGNGWFGGLLPTAAFALVAASGNMYSGLWYVVATAAMSLVVGGLFIRDTRRTDLN
jgi:MFS family permease